MKFSSTFLFVSLFIFVQNQQQTFDDYYDYDEEYGDENFPLINTTITTMKKINSTSNQTSSTKTKTKTTRMISSTTTHRFVTPFIVASHLVEQFNHYRHLELLNRIKMCDSTMKLDEICETFSFDNHTYALIRTSHIEFPSLQNLFDALINRFIVEKLFKTCSSLRWCLNNLTREDIRFTFDVIRQRGRSFCSLAKCHHRLTSQITTCPKLFPQNFSVPTVKLLPMLCTLYREPTTWNSNECIQRVVHLLHFLFAFWSKIETCHRMMTSGSTSCTTECLAFDEILRQVQNQCYRNASFLSHVPTLSWYRNANLKQLCRHQSISPVKDFISSNIKWYHVHHHQIYVTLFVIVILIIVISFSVCLYCMSRNSEMNTRRLDDNYEYTRLQDASYELVNSSEVSNETSTSNGTTNSNRYGNGRFTENQRLLYLDSS